MKRIEKCPCCGSDAAFVGTVAEIDYADCDGEIPVWAEEHWAVICDYLNGGCGMSTGRQYPTQQAAIDAWNRRNAMDARVGKADINLDGKCGGCRWGEEIEFCGSDCYVRCINPVLHGSSAIRRRQGVDQLDLDGSFIRRWPTAREAGRVLGLNPQNITNVLKGRAKTAGNFIWRYAEQC